MLVFTGLITHTTALACLGGLRQALAREPAAGVEVDASALIRFDSAALAVLLELRRETLQMGKTFAVINVPQRLQDLARLYGIGELLPACV